MSQDKPVAFKREDRYLVIKREDIAKYLRDDQQVRLRFYADEIAMRRIEDGKTNHGYVVVSDDWPEYETVFQMIEARVTGKPVAAQEPVAEWKYGRFLNLNYTVLNPNTCVPLYDHAVPCADPIAWRNIASPNGIRRFMTQKQYDANTNLQKYYEPFTCARCADAEQLHYKEMAERTVQEEFLLAAHADLETKITEQAEELRIIRANEAQLEKDFDRRNEEIEPWKESAMFYHGLWEKQAERTKALEALSMQSNQDHLNARKDYQTKLAKADAVILQVKDALSESVACATIYITNFPANQIKALAAIEQYQKGE